MQGKTWERLPQQPEEDARFTAIYFVDESHGWLTAVKRAFTDRYGLGNSSIILVTDDGGRSWKPQASFPTEVVITEIRFLNANEGFAVGAQVIESKPPFDELLVLMTSNGGKEWNNISEAAKPAIKDENGLLGDSGKHIEWTRSSVLLLTRYGRILTTTDNGKTWKVVAAFKRELAHGINFSTGYLKLVLDAEQRISVVATGQGGDYVGDFIAQENGRWTSYEVKMTPILDAVFLSAQEVLACGLNVRPENQKANSRLKDAGVILRSFDNGKSWQSIYRSKSGERFFFVAKVKDNEFYALSDIGTFVRLTIPQ